MPETLPAEGWRCLRLTRTTRSKNLKQGACGAALNAPTKRALDTSQGIVMRPWRHLSHESVQASQRSPCQEAPAHGPTPKDDREHHRLRLLRDKRADRDPLCPRRPGPRGARLQALQQAPQHREVQGQASLLSHVLEVQEGDRPDGQAPCSR